MIFFMRSHHISDLMEFAKTNTIRIKRRPFISAWQKKQSVNFQTKTFNLCLLTPKMTFSIKHVTLVVAFLFHFVVC